MHVEAMDQARFEPTVLRATRRHRVAVLLLVGLSTAIGITVPLLERPAYTATAGITVPLPAGATEQTAGAFLDGQVLLLRSSAVAERAAVLAADAVGPGAPEAADYLGDAPAFVVKPPESSSSGSYGASTILVTFTWPDARVAQVGVNAAVEAFNQVRADTIRSQGDATAAALQRAADEAPNPAQRDSLLSQRSQVLANQQIDLIARPTVAGGVLPEAPTNRDWPVGAAVGLLLGLLIGPTLAYTWASLRGGFDEASEPADYYGVPLLGEIDARPRRRRRGRRTATARTPEEDMRFAATALEHTRAAVDSNQVIVAVAPRGSGATGAAVAGMALALAEGGRRVLVVAADPSDTTVSDQLGVAATGPGLAELVAGTAAPGDVVRPSPWNIDLAVVGPGTAAARLPAGEAYRRAAADVLGALAEGTDLVLVAAPGLLDAAVAGELVEAGHSVVLVLSRREPRRDHLAMAQRLALSRATVLGYVFLPVEPPRGRTPDRTAGPEGSAVAPEGSAVAPEGGAVAPDGAGPPLNGAAVPGRRGSEVSGPPADQGGGPHHEDPDSVDDAPDGQIVVMSATNGSRPTPFPRADE
ncbi:hypothetical protein [Pseudonocardia xishanensis]|uniref:Mrp family chromosome partitioning ATPase n=1 Tax=Pseudonocardia xishanensis TaxID=630995 RepID=A0ABP8S132_9PSEU